MGNRISISFKNGNEESVAFFSHWDGESLVKQAHKYVEHLKLHIKLGAISKSDPLGRLEPERVMLDFIHWFFSCNKSTAIKPKSHITSNYYLVKDENGGDNSDNGHHVEFL